MRSRGRKIRNIIITVIIYGLSAYLLILLGFGTSISENLITSAVKQMVYGRAEQILQKENRSSHNQVADVILDMASTPVTSYSEKEGEIKKISQVQFYLQDESKEEVNTEQKEEETPEQKEPETKKIEIKKTEIQSEEPQNKDTQSKDTQKPETVASAAKTNSIDPSTLTYDFLMKNYYTVVSATSLRPDDMDIPKMMAMDMKMKTGNDKPQILIYHTHGQEGFSNSVENDPSTRIIGVGDYLVQLLEGYGYNVVHITDSFDYVNGVFDRSKAYDYAYDKIAKVLAENPSIEMVIDLHRDGVGENTHLVTEINGKPTAQIMFFNGISRLNSVGEIGYLYNPYRTENLALSLQMKVLSEEYFHGFTRRNYIQAYQYNLHLRPKSMLIEAGAQTNTFEEVRNAMEPLAFLLHECLGGGQTP